MFLAVPDIQEVKKGKKKLKPIWSILETTVYKVHTKLNATQKMVANGQV